LSWDGAKSLDVDAAAPEWRKWSPSEPIPASWYDISQFERLVAAHIKRDENAGCEPRTVREFISQFSGFSGSAKQRDILERTGLARTPLSSLFYDV
jgi:hypothetical protein